MARSELIREAVRLFVRARGRTGRAITPQPLSEEQVLAIVPDLGSAPMGMTLLEVLISNVIRREHPVTVWQFVR